MSTISPNNLTAEQKQQRNRVTWKYGIILSMDANTMRWVGLHREQDRWVRFTESYDTFEEIYKSYKDGGNT